MAKKDLQSMAGKLSSLVSALPTQRPPAALTVVESAKPKRAASPSAEPERQVSLFLRASLRRQLIQLHTDADMTLRGFILDALKAKGLDVTEADLADRRKRPG